MRQPADRMHVTQMLRLLASLNGTPDGVLLERFVRSGDEGAFNALLRRYGELVWGVCRRIAPAPQDAEDAFQATFIVLLRRAGTLHGDRPLGPWLYGVAVRVSRAARSAARRRDMASLPAEDLLPAARATEMASDWQEFVDREVQRLPELYRDAFIVCEIEGRSRREAAGLLGVPEGTLSSRLATAKKRLTKRLSARGLGVPAAGLSSLALGLGAEAAPTSLKRLTAAAVLQVLTAPRGWEALLPASVVTLTRGGTVSMLSTTWKLIGVGVLTLGLAGGGWTLGVVSAGSGPNGDAAAGSALAAANPDPTRADEAGPAPAAAPAPEDDWIEAWLQVCRDRMLKDRKNTERIDRWLAEIRQGTQPADRKADRPPRQGEPIGTGTRSKPAPSDFYKGLYAQGHDKDGVKASAAPFGAVGPNRAQGGLYIPTPDGGWMEVGERILTLERELRETRRQLDELKKRSASRPPVRSPR